MDERTMIDRVAGAFRAEVVEMEEEEPQGSTPVKERRKEAGRTADQEYKERRREVDRLMASVHKKLRSHGMDQERAPDDWGYAGDMGRVLGLLVEIDGFLGG